MNMKKIRSNINQWFNNDEYADNCSVVCIKQVG